jgi:hypothetical protein
MHAVGSHCALSVVSLGLNHTVHLWLFNHTAPLAHAVGSHRALSAFFGPLAIPSYRASRVRSGIAPCPLGGFFGLWPSNHTVPRPRCVCRRIAPCPLCFLWTPGCSITPCLSRTQWDCTAPSRLSLYLWLFNHTAPLAHTVGSHRGRATLALMVGLDHTVRDLGSTLL